MTPIRVLLVDDDSEIRELLSEYLRSYGIEATAVADGTAMRQAFAAERFELVILDLMLPGEDGISLCRALRATRHRGINAMQPMGGESGGKTLDIFRRNGGA